MSRPSTRVSHFGAPPSSVQSAAAIAKMNEKKKEYDAVAALHKVSSLYIQRIEGFADDCEIMADAGRIHGDVLEQWPRMFEILNLFLSGTNKDSAEDNDVVGQQLVRIPIEDLQDPDEDKEKTTVSTTEVPR